MALAMSPQADLADVARSICASEGLNFGRDIGGGVFKRVFLVEKRGNEVYALKVVIEASHRTAREIAALQRCNHSNIARLHRVGRHNYQGRGYDYMIEEFLSGGTLTYRLEQLGRLNNEQTLNLGKKMIDAIIHLSGIGLVHRDIKPDNIMFRENGSAPVLVDFGLVRDLTATSLTETWAARGPGTPYYSAPEQLNNQKSLIDWRTDQFSLGVVLCWARFGAHPFKHRNETDFSVATVERVARRGNRNTDILTQICQSGLPCLEKMTRLWPVQRYRLPEELSQDWINQG